MNEGLRSYWETRYERFSLEESGCLGAGPRLAALIYSCQQRAIVESLRSAGFTSASRYDVLDMGCGFGHLAGLYDAEFPQASYTGVDISSRAIDHARATRPRHEFFAGDVVSWSHPDHRRFDVVQSINVLQLLVDDAEFVAAFKNLVRHLAADGVIVVPLAFSDQPSLNPLHRIRTRESFDRLLRELGLTVAVEVRMFYWLIDGGPTNRLLRAVFARTGAFSLYLVDRLACRLGLVNRHPDHHLSRARMLLIRRQRPAATGPRSRESAD
jgi:SAM-dependent methyltransferase